MLRVHRTGRVLALGLAKVELLSGVVVSGSGVRLALVAQVELSSKSTWTRWSRSSKHPSAMVSGGLLASLLQVQVGGRSQVGGVTAST